MEKNVDKKVMGTLPFIIALDFDGTLVTDSFPHIGMPNEKLFGQAKAWRRLGYKLVLWTCRDGARLEDAVAFCSKHGLMFDAVNKNIPEVIEMFNNDTRKIYANVYIDDKNLTPDIPLYWIPKEYKPWHLNRV